jgi:hypothetical protein
MRAELTETGTGDCNWLPQAEENSRIAAAEKLVARLVRQNSLKPSQEELEILRAYVAKYADRRQVESSATVFRTTLALGPTFSSPKVFGPYLADRRRFSTSTVEDRIEAVRKQFATRNPNASVDGFLERAVSVPLGGGAVKLQQVNREGAFEVVFNIKRLPNGAASASVAGINVFEDASLGSTRWSFAVLSGSKVKISLPVQRWEDSGRPTRCTIDPTAGFSAEVATSDSGVPLTVVALKPKVID